MKTKTEVCRMNIAEERLVRNGQAIKAIRQFQARTNVGMAAGKREVDRIRKATDGLRKLNSVLNQWACGYLNEEEVGENEN